jgi:hypothetical protein
MSSERRYFPRVLADLDAEVINTQGERNTARLCNLSLGGLLLRGDANLQRLARQQQTNPGTPFTPVEVQVRLSLPVGDGVVPASLLCRHLHTRRVAQDVYELGFKILTCDSADPEALGRYITSVAVPR